MSLVDDFFRTITPRSAAEQEVDKLYAPVKAYSNSISDELASGAPVAYNAPDTSLSWWDRLKESVVPVSYGETIVDQIYGPGGTRGITPDPNYDTRDFSSPNVYVQGKAALKDSVSALSSMLNNKFLLLAGLLVVLVAVYAVVPAMVRR